MLKSIINNEVKKGQYNSVGAMLKDKTLWTLFGLQISLLTFLVGTIISAAIKQYL